MPFLSLTQIFFKLIYDVNSLLHILISRIITGHDEDKAKLKSLNGTVTKLKGNKP